VGRPGGMLLRPPVLDQAEAWLTFRPAGAPAPTAETEAFIAQSRKVTLAAQRLRRIALASIFALMIIVILGLVGWIKQDYLIAQWRWWTVTWPYARVNVWPYVLSTAKEQALNPGESFKECAQDCPEMIVVPAGSFTMGSAPSEKGRSEPEGPQHNVTIPKPFAVSKFELTFSDWDACVTGGGCDGYKPTDQGWGRGQQPVINTSWNDAQAYLVWLSAVTGKTYRLLSESEYEYATRAGTTTAYFWGDDIGKNNANCNDCGSEWDGRQTSPVGSFKPNAFGLYDMVGNIWEWIEDCVHENYNDAPTDGSAWMASCRAAGRQNILRGGGWGTSPDNLRSAGRLFYPTDARVNGIGFHVARSLVAPRVSVSLSLWSRRPVKHLAVAPKKTFRHSLIGVPGPENEAIGTQRR
jgi:formylglycine-generating enzyme required for sulfatase activity